MSLLTSVSVMSRLSVLESSGGYKAVASDDAEADTDYAEELEAQAHEFQIGCVGVRIC